MKTLKIAKICDSRKVNPTNTSAGTVCLSKYDNILIYIIDATFSSLMASIHKQRNSMLLSNRSKANPQK